MSDTYTYHTTRTGGELAIAGNIFTRMYNRIFSQRSLTDANTDTQFNGAMSPGKPLDASPIEGEPRQWVYRPGYNLTTPQADKRVSYEYIRKVAREYDLLARCLSKRKEELRNLHWSIQPRERANKKMMHDIQERNADEIRNITDFFEHPEGYMKRVNNKWVRMPLVDYQSSVNAILDDVFNIGAAALYPRSKRNGELLSMERIAADTIKILLDNSGRYPIPPAAAYQQFVYGVPRENFTADELVYRVYNPTNDQPYGYSLVEQILKHIQLAMNSEEYYSSYFTQGSIPEILFQVPAEWNQAQLEEFADYMNSRLKGNPKALREFNPIPNGTTPVQLRPFTWDYKFVNWVATQTCILTGIQPSEMGIAPNDGGTKTLTEAASRIHDKQTTWIAQFIQNMFTDIIKYYWGNDDLCFCFDHLLEKEERERAEINQILIDSGQKSIDQILVENGEEPEGINRIKIVGDRIYGLPDLLALSQYGATAVNLGQIGGIRMPDDTFTQDVQITQSVDPNQVETPNPKQTEDATARLDTSNKEQPKPVKSQPPQPPKPRAATPNGPTVNTVKSTLPDATKAASDANDAHRKRDTHELELLFLASYVRTFAPVRYVSTMLNPQLALAAFTLSQSQRQQLSNALYTLKRDVYTSSFGDYARAHGLSPITQPNAATDASIRDSVAKSIASIADTYASDLRDEYTMLVREGVINPRDIVDRLNTWRRDRGRWKSEQIVTSEIAKPWNDAVFDVDKQLGITDEREYIVQPDQCVCANCQAMVDNNPYTYDEARQLPIPNHPGCIHTIVSQAKTE